MLARVASSCQNDIGFGVINSNTDTVEEPLITQAIVLTRCHVALLSERSKKKIIQIFFESLIN